MSTLDLTPYWSKLLLQHWILVEHSSHEIWSKWFTNGELHDHLWFGLFFLFWLDLHISFEYRWASFYKNIFYIEVANTETNFWTSINANCKSCGILFDHSTEIVGFDRSIKTIRCDHSIIAAWGDCNIIAVISDQEHDLLCITSTNIKGLVHFYIFIWLV